MTVLQFPANAKTVPDGHLTSADFAHAADISYRQLDYWCRTGYLHPVEPQPGSGYVRAFPASELATARLVSRLVDAGMQPRPAFDLARELLERGTAEIAGIRLYLPEDL